MRPIGYTLLAAGFLWIVWDAFDGFVSYQHTRWIWQSQQLPAGETVRRDDAVTAMRGLSLDLKDRHRVVLIPTLMMLGGACILGIKRQHASRNAATAKSDPRE